MGLAWLALRLLVLYRQSSVIMRQQKGGFVNPVDGRLKLARKPRLRSLWFGVNVVTVVES